MALLRSLYAITIFLSAFLLFVVEPMAAKQLLPTLGGSSAVRDTRRPAVMHATSWPEPVRFSFAPRDLHCGR